MNLWQWSESTIHKLGLWDYALLKTVLVLIGMILGAYVSDFVRDNIWTFAVIAGVGYLVLIYRVFK